MAVAVPQAETVTPKPFRIGAVFPTREVGADPVVIRDFAQAIEGMGYSHLTAYDQVIGANHASRPGWKDSPHSHQSMFQEPLVLFSYLSGLTRTLEFFSGIIVLPQRQTVLFGKQVACLDNYCQGRLRLGVGAGMNTVDYEALGVPFETRGTRMDEQIRVLRRLWTEASIAEHSEFHRISDAGFSPHPLQDNIPLWIGGFSRAAMNRTARLGDGWFTGFKADVAQDKVGELREAVLKAGRDPNAVGLENSIVLGRVVDGPPRTAEDAVVAVGIWKQAGAVGVSVDTMEMGLGGADQHLAFFREVARMLEL
jgi:probable F420-dependent oxidoreductase